MTSFFRALFEFVVAMAFIASIAIVALVCIVAIPGALIVVVVALLVASPFILFTEWVIVNWREGNE